MAKMYKISKTDMTFVIVFLFLIGFTAGTLLAPERIITAKTTVQTLSIQGEKVIKTGLPAVDSEGNGVAGTLITTVRPGTGQVLVNVNDVFAQFDTQLSGRTAAKAASNYTKIDLSNLDIIYDIQVNASIIEGPSAGASLASSIVLALEDIPSSDSIMITGTINEDGTIGPVGSIPQKAQAAKETGAVVFLVPKNQGTELTATRVRECKQVSYVEVCQVKYDYGRVNIGESLNITVREVGTLGDIINVYKERLDNFELISK